MIRYVALGDSYTIGTSVTPGERFPDRLAGAVPRLDLVANLGVNGYTSRDVLEREAPQLIRLEPGFMTLLVGVNDAVQDVDAATYVTNVAAIIDDCLALVAADRIVTVGIPDYTVTPAGVDYGDPGLRRAAIEKHNAVMARLSAERGVAFVDIIDLSRQAEVDRSLVAEDGLHPSGAQYALWVERIAPLVARLVGG